MKRLLPMLLLVFSVGVEAETINYSGGGIYVGQASNGTPNGQGSMTWTDGAKYVGDKKLWLGSSKTDQTQKTKPAA
jgi:hypothetical protein